MNFAISNKADWKGVNTQVLYNNSTNCSSIHLHGHLIATFDHNLKALKIDSCGYTTVTTKSRLNALLEGLMFSARVFQNHWDWYLSYNKQTVDFWDNMILVNGEVV